MGTASVTKLANYRNPSALPASSQESAAKILKINTRAIEPMQLAQNAVVTTVEVLSGIRPSQQLYKLVTPDLLGKLLTRHSVLELVRSRLNFPVKSKICRVIATRTVLLSRDISESSIVVHDNGRTRAAAVRCEEINGKWRVTALELG